MAFGGPLVLLAILGVIAAAALTVMVFMYVLVPLLKGLGWLIGRFFWFIGATISHIFQFVAGMFRDSLRAVGAIPVAFVFSMLAVGSVVVGRWSAAAHFASNMQREVITFFGCIYRVCLAHPLRLVGLHPMLEGLEQRVPAAVAEMPGPEKPNRRTGKFDGYEIVGSLPGGGSGGRLYIASPTIEKRGQITKAFGECPERVVIKAFAVADGSSLPQIVRESRALECAKQLGLILDHELTDERFFYAMPYVPGENLSAIARNMHTRAGDRGLQENDLRLILSHIGDVLNTLDAYHRGGLWHKDIKPENIIVSDDGRAHVVDLGLVTPLRSAMTLTTHGTEYFRDPELVRLALKGVKVHEVDGTKFDIYAAGAVLFYMIENTFPSHGGLSTISRRCPEAVKWIVRRAMTDYSKRYNNVSEMYEDIKAVATNARMYDMKPADLPSLRGTIGASASADLHEAANPAAPSAGPARSSFNWSEVTERLGAVAASAGAAAAAGYAWNRPRERKKYRFKITNWWTGAYEPVGARESIRADVDSMRDEIRRAGHDVRTAVRQAASHAQDAVQQMREQWAGPVSADDNAGTESFRYGSPVPPTRTAPDHGRYSAHEQVFRARSRAADLRRRARNRGSQRKVRAPGERLTVGMVVAACFVFGFLGICVLLAYGLISSASRSGQMATPFVRVERPLVPPIGVQPGLPDTGPIVERWSRGAEQNAPSADGANAEMSNSKPSPARDAIGLSLPAGFPTGYLVINNHPQPANADVARSEQHVESLVESLGFTQVHDENYEALIRARVDQWLSGPYAVTPGDDFDNAERSVGNLLGREIESVGCVVWLYPIADKPGDVGYWVITPDAINSTVDDQILGYLLSHSN